jgi:hypothetical protein
MSAVQPPESNQPPEPTNLPEAQRPPQTPPSSESTAPRPIAPQRWSPADRVTILTDHFVANARSHTPDALGRSALEAGYTQEDVTTAIVAADARLTAAENSALARTTAQRTILAMYVMTYLAFAFLLLSQEFYGYGAILLTILTVAMLLALGLSALWVRRGAWREPGASVGAILSVPIILLLLVAGPCAYTTFPSIGR